MMTHIYLDISNLVCSTVCRIEMKSANAAVSCPSFDLYVSILSKTCSPGILDEPVILSLVSIMAISYHCYFMIQVILATWVSVLLTASAVIVNTVMIVIEDRSASLFRSRQGCRRQCGRHLRYPSRCNVESHRGTGILREGIFPHPKF